MIVHSNLLILLLLISQRVDLFNSFTVNSQSNSSSGIHLRGLNKSTRCSNFRVRRNVLSLSDTQLDDFIDSLKKLYEDQTIDRFASYHRLYYFPTHNQPLIFWWHRYFIWKFENELQRIKPGLAIPYWDASEDSKEPHKSIVLTDKYFGGNGEESSHCVVNSFLKSIHTKLPDGEVKCIKRFFNGTRPGTLNPWNDTQSIVNIIKTSKTSDEFRIRIEDSIHLDVHSSLGSYPEGFMNSPISPLDPLFYLLHSNLDRWLYTWQSSSPERLDMVNGFQHLEDGTIIELSKDYHLNGYLNISLDQILRIQEEPLCYTYDYLPLDKL